MPAPPAPEATWFLTASLKDRGSRVLVDQVAELRAACREVFARHPFRIDAMVVLPDHLHALWTLPDGDADFGARWSLLREAFARRVGAPQGARRKGALWNATLWEHRIADADDLNRHLDYIHFNPVKHGWVLRARDWPYSSLHRYVREGKLPQDWGIGAAIEGRFGE